MCGRYAFMPEDMEPGFMAAVARMNREEKAALSQGEIRPGDTPAAIMMQGGAPAARRMRWGMPMADRSRLVINARSEKVEQTGMFAGLLENNRCLLPANLYYEWTRDAAHTRMKITGGSEMYMAGLFRACADEARWEFVVLTKQAVGDVARVHDRMPLLLPDRESRRGWLRDGAYARQLLRTPPQALLKIVADEPEQTDLFSLIDGIEL